MFRERANRRLKDSKIAVRRSFDPCTSPAGVFGIGDERPVDFDAVAVLDDRVAWAALAENPDWSMRKIRHVEPRFRSGLERLRHGCARSKAKLDFGDAVRLRVNHRHGHLV